MCTFRADFALKAFLQVLHLNGFLRVLFSAAMSDILKQEKPIEGFGWIFNGNTFCVGSTGWLFVLPEKMPQFLKLESQLYLHSTKRTKKLICNSSK